LAATNIWLPTGRGDELQVPTTVAHARRSPSPSQACARSNIASRSAPPAPPPLTSPPALSPAITACQLARAAGLDQVFRNGLRCSLGAARSSHTIARSGRRWKLPWRSLLGLNQRAPGRKEPSLRAGSLVS